MIKFNKTIYYIEGLNLMVGEVDNIERYNSLIHSKSVYDDLNEALNAIIDKIDICIETNTSMIQEFQNEIKKETCLFFDLSKEYVWSIKHLKKQTEEYKSKRTYYEKML